MSTDVVARAKAAMAAVGAGSIGNLIALVPELVAEVEKLRGAIETISDKAGIGVREAIVNRPKMERALFDILAVIERIEKS